MDTRVYTDREYLPLNELKGLGEDFVAQVNEYRSSFVEVLFLGNQLFARLVETPALVKRRFTKNIEIKGMIDIDAPGYDYVLEIAKQIVKNEDLRGISEQDKNELLRKFKENNNDLTLVTEFVSQNINSFLVSEAKTTTPEHTYPWLTKYDINFINKYRNINMNYSIVDYQNLNHCSYETSRKSLEKLEENKLYEKVKVGKKFVYKPTEKLVALLGGKK